MNRRFLLIAAIAAFVFSCAPLSPTNDKAAGSNTRLRNFRASINWYTTGPQPDTRQTWIPLPLKKSRCCANT